MKKLLMSVLIAFVILLTPSSIQAATTQPTAAQTTDAAVQQMQTQLAMLQMVIAQYDGVTVTDPNQIAALDLMKTQAAQLQQQLAAAGITATPVATPQQKAVPQQQTAVQNQAVTTPSAGGGYIGNANSKKFHRASCSSVSKMKDSNKVVLDSRDSAIAAGYTPCKICKP